MPHLELLYINYILYQYFQQRLNTHFWSCIHFSADKMSSNEKVLIYLWSVIGLAVFYECPTDWCLVGCMGQEVLLIVDGVLHLCPHPADEDKPMVGVMAQPTLSSLCAVTCLSCEGIALHSLLPTAAT